MEGYTWLPVAITVSRKTLEVIDIQYDWCKNERVACVIMGLARVGRQMMTEEERNAIDEEYFARCEEEWKKAEEENRDETL